MICTYEQFLFLLRHAIETLDWSASQQTVTRHADLTLVDFKAFKTSFWPRFPHHLTKGLSPDLAFSEIMGVIKGSFRSCKSLTSLDLSQYENLSFRLTPNVSRHEDRVKIFHLYQAYEELKRKTGDIDSIDLVVRLLRQLQDNPSLIALLAPYIQEVYVDEVQDQRCLDISLLLTIVQDPLGLHLGGDTAQAISPDSVFRFQDVKALFYDRFFHKGTSVAQQRLAEPRMFTLNRNYRSHQGILSVASSVMGMLWTTFPDTIDKLEPEVGTMVGPAPILYQNCNSSIFIRQEREMTATMQIELLFGAEQVIIARDDDCKADLVNQVGEVALVLTVLQSKGMEFDDVIIWNFFSGTPDAVGWRSLSDFIHGKVPFFDTAKHAVLCSELKNLYVAITRARVRVLFIETSGDAAQPFVRLVNKDSPLALLEVTSPDATNFDEKIKALQPRRSDDPHRWLANGEDMMARGLYSDAVLCFRRAHNPLKEKEAKAHLQEEQGVELQVKGKLSESQTAFRGAATDFEELGLISDAARVLIRGEYLENAAELWYKHKNFEQAAVLFEKISNYQRAFESWHTGSNINKAIMALRSALSYDKMIQYLDEHQGSLSVQERNYHKHIVKLLLKKQTIAADNRVLAIGLVGTCAEQESFYLEYGMITNLLELYRQQQAMNKLFNLLLELGDLEEAWELVPSLDPHTERYPDKLLLVNIEALIWVNRIYTTSCDAGIPLDAAAHGKIDSWESASSVLHGDWDHSISQSRILSMDDGSIIKTFLCLYVTVHLHITASNTTRPRWVSPKDLPSKDYNNQRSVSDHQSIETGSGHDSRDRLVISSFDDIPFDILLHAIKLVTTQPFNTQSIVGQAVLLLSGVFQSFDTQRKYITRAWSPLSILNHSSKVKASHLAEAAMRLTINRVAGAILPAHETMKQLFRAKWPTRCNFYLVNDNCKSNDESHRLLSRHEHVSSDAYAAKLNDLLRVNKPVCQLTPLYYRRAMSGQLSEKFLGVRRSWLESLIRELSFVSGFEQDSLVLMTVAERFRTDESLGAVSMSIEDNIFFKAHKEWKLQAHLGYVLEQLDCVAHLKTQVRQRLVWRTRAQLRHDQPSTHQSLVLAETLQAHVTSGDPVQYCQALQSYLQMLQTLKPQDFATFHCHTNTFEAVSLYLLLQMSQSALMIPRSWLDLHIAGILNQNDLGGRPSWDQRCTFRDALLLLLKTFIDLLHRLNESLQNDAGFYVCGTWYHSRILQQRNAELLAVIMVNLATISSLRPLNLMQYWGSMVKVFQLPTVKALQLDHAAGKVTELQMKLLSSHARYRDKNPLIVLHVVDIHPHPFTKLQQSHKLHSHSLSTLQKRYISVIPSANPANPGIDQGAREEKAAVCIQRHWRHHGRRTIARHSARDAFADTDVGRAVARLRAVGKGSGFKSRYKLVYYGVDCLVRLDRLTADISDIRKRAINFLDTATFEQSEALESVLEVARTLGDGLKAHHNQMSEQALGSLIRLENDTAFKELLTRRITQIGEEEAKVNGLCRVFDSMS